MSEETDGENIDLTDFSQDQAGATPAEPSQAESDDGGGASEAAPSDADATTGANPTENTEADAPLSEQDFQRSASDLEAVFEIPVNIAAVLGGTNMEVSDLLKLNEGDVVELDRKVGEAIDIFVNNRLVARGEVVLVEERLGVTMTEIIKSERH